MNKFWLHISTKHTAKPVFTPTLFIPVLELSMVDWTWLCFFTGLHPFSQDVAVSFDKLEFEILNDESDDAMNDDFSDQSASDHNENTATRDFKVKQKSSKISTVKGADKSGGEICKIVGHQLIRLLEILGANDSTGLHPLGHMTIRFWQSGVPLRDLPSRRILKLWYLSWIVGKANMWWFEVEVFDLEANIE